jgi:DNA-binding CsgD family transcriptional regulator
MLAQVEALTDRQRQILDGLAEGLTDAEIADELFLSRETIKGYTKHVYAKLGARNRTHAVALAYHHGLLVPKRL